MDKTLWDRAATALRGYFLGLCFTLAALVLSHFTRPLIGREGPFLWGMVAIICTAYFAGWGPALLAIALLTFDAGRFLTSASIHPGLYDEIIPLVVFVPVGIGMTAFLVSRERALTQLRESNVLLHHLLQRETQNARELADTVAKLEHSQWRYRIVSSVTDDALWEWDPARERFEWSDGITRVFGHKPEDVRGDFEWWQAKLHPDDRVRVVKSFHRAIGSWDDAWSDEFRFRKADGQYASVMCRARILRSDDTVAMQVNGSMMDVTGQRQAERVLKRNQRFLRQMLRSLPIPVMLLDGDGRIKLFNRACERLSGYRRNEVIDHRPDEIFIHPDDADAFARRIADPLAPQVHERHNVIWLNKDGEPKHLEWQFTPISSDDPNGLPWLLGAAVALHAEPAHA
jgi:PAS domain S-box-containing protein